MFFLGLKHSQSLHFGSQVTYETLQMELAICLIAKGFQTLFVKIDI